MIKSVHRNFDVRRDLLWERILAQRRILPYAGFNHPARMMKTEGLMQWTLPGAESVKKQEISICISAEHKTTKKYHCKRCVYREHRRCRKRCCLRLCRHCFGQQGSGQIRPCGIPCHPVGVCGCPADWWIIHSCGSKLKDYNPETCILRGEIVNVSVDERALDKNGKVDASKVIPVIFDPFNNDYLKVGEKVVMLSRMAKP